MHYIERCPKCGKPAVVVPTEYGPKAVCLKAEHATVQPETREPAAVAR